MCPPKYEIFAFQENIILGNREEQYESNAVIYERDLFVASLLLLLLKMVTRPI